MCVQVSPRLVLIIRDVRGRREYVIDWKVTYVVMPTIYGTKTHGCNWDYNRTVNTAVTYITGIRDTEKALPMCVCAWQQRSFSYIDHIRSSEFAVFSNLYHNLSHMANCLNSHSVWQTEVLKVSKPQKTNCQSTDSSYMHRTWRVGWWRDHSFCKSSHATLVTLNHRL